MVMRFGCSGEPVKGYIDRLNEQVRYECGVRKGIMD